MYELIISVLKEWYKPILIILVMGLCILFGWKLNTYYTGYQLSIEQKIQKQVDAGIDKIQQQSAQNLIQTQQTIKDNATKIVTTQVPVIVTKEIYKNVCLDEDGIKVLQQLKQNSSDGRKMIK